MVTLIVEVELEIMYHDDVESVPRATDEDTENAWQNSSVIAPIHLSAGRYLETKRDSFFPRADGAMIATWLSSTGPTGLMYATPRIDFIIAENAFLKAS